MKQASVLFVLSLFCVFGRPVFASLEKEYEYWSQYQLSYRWQQSLNIKVNPDFRFRDHATDYYYTHIEGGLDWMARQWLVFSLYYRHIYEEKAGKFTPEYRPHADLTLKWKFQYMELEDRNRLEYRVREAGRTFRYVTKITLKLPALPRIKGKPYLSEELFYDFEVSDLNKIRSQAGADFPVYRSLSAGLFFMVESRLKDSWIHVPVLGTKIGYTIPDPK